MAIVYGLLIVVFICSLVITPLVIKFSKKFNLVDIPKDSRRVHIKPMPRVGGIAIVLSMFIGFAIYYFITKDIPSIALNEKFLGYIIGAFIIFLMGLIDDVFNLRARYKFVFQLAAGCVIYYFGMRISGIKIPFIYTDLISFGWLSFPITLTWIIGVTNAVNLIDGLDGLAAGISAISATALLTIFIATSASLEAIIITAVLVGATLGFLPYNFNPAKTFMGDVGSNFLGFTLAVVSMLGFAKGYTLLAIIAPILALGVPIFDTVFAMVRRFLKGQPMLKPDGAHVHHRLINRGLTQRQAVLVLYTVTSVLCIIAVVIISADIWKLILLILATVCFVILGYISMKRTKEHPEDNQKQVNENFKMDMVFDQEDNKQHKHNKQEIDKNLK
ncbi:MAG: MraY family glycosyltransferase [Clostridia bacterium]